MITIFELSDLLLRAKQSVHLFSNFATFWTPQVQQDFLRNPKQLPKLQKQPFDATKVVSLFKDVQQVATKANIDQKLKQIVLDIADGYINQALLVQSQHTKQIQNIATKMWGNCDAKLLALANEIKASFGNNQTSETKTLTSTQAARLLETKLENYFGQPVYTSTKAIPAEAEVLGCRLVLRKGSLYSQRDVDLLEAHEGWVHLATWFNAQQQKLSFLKQDSVHTCELQEGLGVITELFAGRSFPNRIRKLADRVLACHMALQGANFCEVFAWFTDKNYGRHNSYNNTVRVFRSGLEGCYHKDIIYLRGAWQVGQTLARQPSLAPWLFAGKMALTDVPVLVEHDLLKPPKFVPNCFIQEKFT